MWLVVRPIGSPYRPVGPFVPLRRVIAVEHVRVEQIRKVADGVGEIDEPILEGPLAHRSWRVT